MTPTKKPSGQSDWYEIAMPAHTVTKAMPTDRAIARAGLGVSDLAAAAGPIIRLNISSAPTTGTDSKAGTLVHEMSHFNVVASTDDWAYGQSAAKSLAISNPTKALDNADTHEYFAENNPAQN